MRWHRLVAPAHDKYNKTNNRKIHASYLDVKNIEQTKSISTLKKTMQNFDDFKNMILLPGESRCFYEGGTLLLGSYSFLKKKNILFHKKFKCKSTIVPCLEKVDHYYNRIFSLRYFVFSIISHQELLPHHTKQLLRLGPENKQITISLPWSADRSFK